MASWEKIAHSKSPGGFYMGWFRRHPMIHMTAKEPAAKTSLVQISWDGYRFHILAQTTSHGVFTQPPGTKGTTLYKKTKIMTNKRAAFAEVVRLKRMLAGKYDKVTGIHRAKR